MDLNDPKQLLELADRLSVTLRPWEPHQQPFNNDLTFVRTAAMNQAAPVVMLVFEIPRIPSLGSKFEDKRWVLYVNQRREQEVKQPANKVEEAKAWADKWLEMDGWLLND